MHFRCEQPTKFSFGVTLDSILSYTTDKGWKKTFIDRTLEKNQNVSINKALQLRSLSFYWNPDDNLFLFEKLSDEAFILKRMREMIFVQGKHLVVHDHWKKPRQILTISAKLKVVFNQPEKIDLPLYEINLSLDRIDIKLEHTIAQQMIQILETYSIYQKMVFLKKKQTQNLNQEIIQQYEGLFCSLFPKV